MYRPTEVIKKQKPLDLRLNIQKRILFLFTEGANVNI